LNLATLLFVGVQTFFTREPFDIQMNGFARGALTALALSLMAACGANGGSSYSAVPDVLAGLAGHKVGPGPIISPQDGGQVYGYDVDWNGTDGILASANQLNTKSFKVSVETFDTKTAKITKSFAVHTGPKLSYLADGIYYKDSALVTRFDVPKGKFYAIRHYQVVNPVTAAKFDGNWAPPVKDLSVLEYAENQNTSTDVAYALELQNNDAPDLVVSDVADNKQIKVLHLDPNQFASVEFPQLAQDTVNNLAVIATSASAGHGGIPKISTVDLRTGQISQFNGADCPGSDGCGSANGISYDSATGIACTTTQLDAGIEFYNVPKQTGFQEVLPVGSSNIAEYYAGTYVASDPVHKLCLVVQAHSGSSQSGSSVQVYDENGGFVESIDGLNFTYNDNLAIPVRIAIDPNTRTGWVNGPTVNQLQEFSY
jgi:hypothetical protein